MSIKIKILKIKIGSHSFGGNKVKIRPKNIQTTNVCMYIEQLLYTLKQKESCSHTAQIVPRSCILESIY